MSYNASSTGVARSKPNAADSEGQIETTTMLLDDDMSEDGTESGISDGVSSERRLDYAAKPVFRVNEEYARRFEHNKKREELHRREYFQLVTLNQSQ